MLTQILQKGAALLGVKVYDDVLKQRIQEATVVGLQDDSRESLEHRCHHVLATDRLAGILSD